MKKIAFISYIFVVLLSSFSTPIFAQVKPKIAIKLPTFLAGDNQLIDKPIEGDLMVAGNNVKITSTVSGDVYVAGSDVQITGSISGNLIVVGKDININGKLGKNLIGAGSHIVVSDISTVAGYTLVGGNNIDLLGKFMGPVKVGARSLTFGDKATISGDLEADINQINIPESTQISGQKNIRKFENTTPEVSPDFGKGLKTVYTFYSFLSQLLVLMILIALFGAKLAQIDTSSSSIWSSLYQGLIGLVITPLVAIILLLTGIGLPLGIIVLIVYFVAIYLSGLFSSVFIGNKLFSTQNIYIRSILGFVLLSLIGQLSIINGFAGFLSLILGLGVFAKMIHAKA